MARRERPSREKKSRKDKPAKPAKAPRAAKVKPAKDLEEVEGGLGIDDSIVLATSVVLGIAVILVFMANGAYS